MGRLTSVAYAGELTQSQSRLVHGQRHDQLRTRRSALRHSRTLDVGWDVHQESSAVASVAKDHDADVIDPGSVGTRHPDRNQLVRTQPAKATHLVLVDEAGPCGSWLSRDLTLKGHLCRVVAPSRMPTQAGDRVNTDRRDAVPWARLLRSGDLTPASVPTVEDKAIYTVFHSTMALTTNPKPQVDLPIPHGSAAGVRPVGHERRHGPRCSGFPRG
jgi:hypothetical protein